MKKDYDAHLPEKTTHNLMIQQGSQNKQQVHSIQPKSEDTNHNTKTNHTHNHGSTSDPNRHHNNNNNPNNKPNHNTNNNHHHNSLLQTSKKLVNSAIHQNSHSKSRHHNKKDKKHSSEKSDNFIDEVKEKMQQELQVKDLVEVDLQETADVVESVHKEFSLKQAKKVSYKTHIFYYGWYGNPEINGKYMHWNHEEIANPFSKGMKKKNLVTYPGGDDIGANFYPKLGCYSSSDESLIHQHLQMIKSAGVGVISVSWYPPRFSDSQIKDSPGFSDENMLDIASIYKIRVCLHVEPYEGRNGETVANDIKYVIDNYAHHPAFYRYPENNLPLFYIYDSYFTSPGDWAKVLAKDSPDTIRGTPYDAVVIALLVDSKHKEQIVKGGFDGAYTYFASEQFTYGSTSGNWQTVAKWANANNLIWIPCVGPGYIDTRIRPWNEKNARDRQNGKYYQKMFNAAIASDPHIISITSFNEWHEGTQIEPAIPKNTSSGFVYLDYSPFDPNYYLEKTYEFVLQFDPQLQPH